MGSIHTDIARYLQQQREMYGNITWADRSREVEAVALSAIESADELIEEPQGAGMPHTVHAAPDWAEASSLEALNTMICGCLDCPLGTTRTTFVFGTGNPNADLMIVGEAPGADEDKQGLPFVGRAGQLLTKILGAILKCRPPNNRKPLVSETDTCEPYLWKQIELVKPRYILALGLTAANTLLKNKETMKNLRGNIHDYHGIPLLVTYHPAALLRNPEWKKSTWEDVQQLKELLDSV